MTSDVSYDLDRALDLCLLKDSKYYKKIYPRTNENLELLFSNFDVSNKDVLSVLASGDQVFSARYLGARKVDSFDINKLTIYYYYLRVWLMKYLNMEYPTEKFFNYGDVDIWKFVYNLEVDTDEELDAKKFWLNYFKITNGLPNGYLFYHTGINNDNVYKDDLSKVASEDMDFYNESIFDELDVDKKYDYIIMSNILEYTTSKEDYYMVSENLKRLLKKDGLCVCSYMMNSALSYDHEYEKHIFDRLGFRVIEFGDFYRDNNGVSREIGYAYRKK